LKFFFIYSKPVVKASSNEKIWFNFSNFWFEKSKASFLNFATSIDSIEKVTGIDFYHKMDSLLQSKVEANKDVSQFEKK
ncbi:MAG: hypothetical protein JKY02_09270, partial [Flavobacteriaceae bacterium]|nr:hypothetical protein [Flavobacteriaceae bacterium]